MHMLSKKGLKFRRFGYLPFVQEPHNDGDGRWEVPTTQEAHVCVHDLHLFVTVQLLDDTPAVLSSGKLCEEHGYSYEWTSGQKNTGDQE